MQASDSLYRAYKTIRGYYARNHHKPITATAAIALERNHQAKVQSWYEALKVWEENRQYPRPEFPQLVPQHRLPEPFDSLRPNRNRQRYVPKGYYVDEFQDETFAPMVFDLPRGRFLAAYRDTCSDFVKVVGVTTDEDTAWRMADSKARYDAEEEYQYHCTYQAASDAHNAREEAREAIKLARQQFRALAKEAKATTSPPTICATVRQKLEELRREVAEAVATIRTATETIETLGMADEFG